MLLVLSLAMAYAGFAALCLSMQRHQRAALAKTLPPRWNHVLRFFGYGLLLLAYLPCSMQTAPSVGVLLWIGMMSAAVILLVAILAWKARPVLWSAPVVLIAAILLQGLTV